MIGFSGDTARRVFKEALDCKPSVLMTAKRAHPGASQKRMRRRRTCTPPTEPGVLVRQEIYCAREKVGALSKRKLGSGYTCKDIRRNRKRPSTSPCASVVYGKACDARRYRRP